MAFTGKFVYVYIYCPLEVDVGLNKAQKYTLKIFKWFHKNRLKYAGKSNLIITTSTSPVEIQVENSIVFILTRLESLED